MLKGWYPLTEDLTNNGLTNYTASGNYTVDNSGKIGKCLKFTSTINTNIPMTEWNINETSVSMGGWFKFPSSEINTLVSSYTYDSSHPNMVGTLVGYNSYGGLALTIITNNIYQEGSYKQLTVNNLLRQGSSIYASGGYTLPLDTWIHIMGVCDRQYLYLYVNGNFISKSGTLPALSVTTDGSFSICRDQIYGGNGPGRCFPVYANDVRLYDEALSPKQIKLLSQGLVLHYTLSRVGGDNLALNSADLTLWAKESGMTCEWDSTEQMYKIDTTTRTSSRWGIYQDFNCEANTTYTFSVEGKKVEKAMYLSVGSYKDTATWPGNQTQFTTTRKRLSYTFTTGADHNKIRMYLAVYPTAEGSNAAYYAFPKLEKSDHVTLWIPNIADAAYTKAGFNNGIEYDISGYGNNGTKEAALTYSTDTPRYNTSTYFDGTDNHCIAVPFANAINSTSPFTINLWWKKTEIGPKNYETLFGGASSPNFEMDTRAGSATTLSLYMASVRGTQYSPFNLNEWYMVTMVSDRINEFYYVNGQLVKTIEAKSMPTSIYRIGAWSGPTSQNYKGYISDFRIYATALSADDILELYNTPVHLTSNGALLTSGELTEV